MGARDIAIQSPQHELTHCFVDNGDTDYVGQQFAFHTYARRTGPVIVLPVQVTPFNSNAAPVDSRQGTQVMLRAIMPPSFDPSGPIVYRAWQNWNAVRLTPSDYLAASRDIAAPETHLFGGDPARHRADADCLLQAVPAARTCHRLKPRHGRLPLPNPEIISVLTQSHQPEARV